MTGHGGDKQARTQGGADGSNNRGLVQGSEAGGGDRRSARLGRAEFWKSRGGGSECPAGSG